MGEEGAEGAIQREKGKGWEKLCRLFLKFLYLHLGPIVDHMEHNVPSDQVFTWGEMGQD